VKIHPAETMRTGRPDEYNYRFPQLLWLF